MINKITLDGVEIPFSDKQDYVYDVIENVYQTESGKDQVSITRDEKLTLSLELKLSAEWEQRMRTIAKRHNIIAVLDEAGVETTRTVRIRSYKASLVQDSRYTPGTAGLWTVTFDLIEY